MGATEVGTMRRVRSSALSSSVAGCGERRPQPAMPLRQRWSSAAGVVGGDAAGEDVSLPGAGGDFKALQLAQRLLQAVLAAQSGAGREVLPAQQPMHELGRRYGLNLLAQGGDGEVVDARQQAPVAPFEVLRRPRGIGLGGWLRWLPGVKARRRWRRARCGRDWRFG